MNAAAKSCEPVTKISILLVDDHSVFREGMSGMINQEPDLLVRGEADGLRSALVELKRLKPDVAVVDLSIRDGDGLELIKEIRALSPQTRVLVLSMYDEKVFAERTLRAGAMGYVMKVEAANAVIAGIRAVHHGEIYLSPRMRAARGGTAPSSLGAGRGNLERLTDREMQVLRCVGRGLSTQEIGDELFISGKTVETHREHIKHKLGLNTSGELLRYAIEHNRLPE